MISFALARSKISLALFLVPLLVGNLILDDNLRADVSPGFGLIEPVRQRAGIAFFAIGLTRHTALQVTLLPEHLRNEEDDNCPKNTSSSQHIHQRIPDSRNGQNRLCENFHL